MRHYFRIANFTQDFHLAINKYIEYKLEHLEDWQIPTPSTRAAWITFFSHLSKDHIYTHKKCSLQLESSIYLHRVGEGFGRENKAINKHSLPTVENLVGKNLIARAGA